MGSNKKNSVVNKFGQCHDINNIFIVDSSIFPSSSGVNIASTVQAVSLMISDYIKKIIKNYFKECLNQKNIFILKNNLKIILNEMIPGNKFMPSFSNAVKVEIILKKLKE